MKLKAPPSIKVLEALGAIADDRVRLASSHEATVTSSDGGRKYEVKWDPSSNEVSSTDSGTTFRGYIGYPIISLLMLQGVLPYEPGLASKLAGINWKRLNDMYKNYDTVIENVLRKWRVPDRERLGRFVKWTLDMLSEIDLEKTEPKKTLQDF